MKILVEKNSVILFFLEQKNSATIAAERKGAESVCGRG